MPPEETKGTFPSVVDLLLGHGLYSPISFTAADWQAIAALEYFAGPLDAYCPVCRRQSVFHGKKREGGPLGMGGHAQHLADRMFFVSLRCTRAEQHPLFFWFRVEKMRIWKIGQHPSYADLAAADLRRYRKALPEDITAELSRAIGLVAHGVGIGSFTYLRRIFERILEAAGQRAAANPDWDQDLFERSRMDEKIDLLKAELPPVLVENRKLYGILSKGLHELTEQECLDAFPVLRVAIELILDQWIEEQTRRKREDQARKEIDELSDKMRRRDP
jgi:hypothetical protein